MKKLIALLCAAALTSLSAASVCAVDSESTTTTINYTVVSQYNISIPPSIDVETSSECTYGVSSGSVIMSADKLYFYISGASDYDATAGFRLENTIVDDVFLGYTITDSSSGAVGMNQVFLEVTAAEANAGKTEKLTYNMGDPSVAGDYSGTVTVTVSTAAPGTP